MTNKAYILSLICLSFAFMANGQEFVPVDSLPLAVVEVDTNVKVATDTILLNKKVQAVADTAVMKKKTAFQPNAKKAGMYSSILPGLGQTYNRQYWKVPIVYAILGTAGYFIGYNFTKYKEYQQAYIYSIDGDNRTNDKLSLQYEASQLKRLQDNYKKDLDVIVLLTSVGYALQIMDAVASAHLKNFDISRDISLKMQPVLQQNYVGLGLVMNFK